MHNKYCTFLMLYYNKTFLKLVKYITPVYTNCYFQTQLSINISHYMSVIRWYRYTDSFNVIKYISHVHVFLTSPRMGESCSIKLFTWCITQVFAYHNRVIKWPRFVTDSTPLIIMIYLKTTRVLRTGRTNIVTNKTYF